MHRSVTLKLILSFLTFGHSFCATTIALADINELRDPSCIKNWGIYHSTSQSGARSDIQALEAWRLQEGSRDIVVAVIDTGIDPNHQALSKNLWKDPSDKKGKFGKNFVDPECNPIDEHGHGTHVAGIIGAELDRELGTSGVAHRVSLMPIKYYSESNSGTVNLSNTIQAIHYAIDHGAKIINYSGGGPEFSEQEYLAIKKAESKGILFIAAAGNEKQNIDQSNNFYFPASYSNPAAFRNLPHSPLKNIVVVAATNKKNDLIPASNWGKTSVDVAAPGEDILSTLPNGRSGVLTGTSQATAFVTGIAALILAENSRLTPSLVKKILIESSDHFTKLSEKVKSSGRVNVYKAVLAAHELRQPILKKGSQNTRLASLPDQKTEL
ncbi:serine protease [bacterium]|jgi:thermitase|nr:serine protease [bacterium]